MKPLYVHDHSNESYWAVLFFMLCKVVQWMMFSTVFPSNFKAFVRFILTVTWDKGLRNNYFIPTGTKCIGICIVQLGWSNGHTRGTVRLTVISLILWSSEMTRDEGSTYDKVINSVSLAQQDKSIRTKRLIKENETRLNANVEIFAGKTRTC